MSDDIDHASREHSTLLGGSVAERRINCPGSYRLEEEYKQKFGDTASEAAEQGTCCHEAISKCLLEDLEPDELIGQTFNDIVLTPDHVDDLLNPALDQLDEYIDNEMDGEAYGSTADKYDFDFLIEKRVHFPGYQGRSWGAADVIGRNIAKSLVLDWKFGSGVLVRAEKNWQGIYYGLCAINTFPHMFGAAADWPIDIAICQPGRYDELDVWHTTRGEIEAAAKTLVKAMKEAEGLNPKFQKGKWCTFCNGLTACPAQASALITLDENKIDATETFGDLDIGAMLELAEDITPFVKAIKAEAYRLLQGGLPVEAPSGISWKLKPGRNSRSWEDEEQAKKFLKGKHGFTKTQDDLYTKTFLSPAQAEAAYKAEGIKKPKELSTQIHSQPGSPVMARSDDPAPAVEPRKPTPKGVSPAFVAAAKAAGSVFNSD